MATADTKTKTGAISALQSSIEPLLGNVTQQIITLVLSEGDNSAELVEASQQAVIPLERVLEAVKTAEHRYQAHQRVLCSRQAIDEASTPAEQRQAEKNAARQEKHAQMILRETMHPDIAKEVFDLRKQGKALAEKALYHRAETDERQAAERKKFQDQSNELNRQAAELEASALEWHCFKI